MFLYYARNSERSEKLSNTWGINTRNAIKGRLDVVEVYVLLPYTERQSRDFSKVPRCTAFTRTDAQTHKRNGNGTHTEARKCSRGPSQQRSYAVQRERSWLVPFESGYRGVNSSCYVTHKTPAYGTPLLYSLHFFTLIYSSDLDIREGYSCPDGKRALSLSLSLSLSARIFLTRYLSL